jgi:hypothetical protein
VKYLAAAMVSIVGHGEGLTHDCTEATAALDEVDVALFQGSGFLFRALKGFGVSAVELLGLVDFLADKGESDSQLFSDTWLKIPLDSLSSEWALGNLPQHPWVSWPKGHYRQVGRRPCWRCWRNAFQTDFSAVGDGILVSPAELGGWKAQRLKRSEVVKRVYRGEAMAAVVLSLVWLWSNWGRTRLGNV